MDREKSVWDLSAGQQTFGLITLQLVMGDGPGGMSAATALPFAGIEPAQAAILADGEFRLAYGISEFACRVPLPQLLPLQQQLQHCFHAFQPFFQRHAAPTVYSSWSG